MSFRIYSIPLFDKQAKRLSKKYPSFKSDLAVLIESLSEKPEQGVALGGGFYKIRLAIASKGKGKSAGARVITYVRMTPNALYLTAIFDKSEKDTISDQELNDIFKQIPE